MDENWLHEKIAEISRTIYSYCRAKTPSQQDAEDLSQDILLELMKSVDNIRNDKAFYAFMWGVAGNVYKQWCRKKQFAQLPAVCAHGRKTGGFHC